MVIICALEKMTENKKPKEGTERREKGKNKVIKNEASMRSGRRPSPEDKDAVCWYD